ncbi:uncharacterized protein [Physcomitrium patens]|uniref:Uncharacterized protein n=1 Tax=Physcomitrium patens TaxID=3218 RepID=A0A2K1KKB8_PHYPA|nr:uncharacterized protein LOC112282515 [Physcomitrium patens]PNR54234.1 hypothetical protein PHYPA_007911 [Physcomitrium patens]|eukprot:XP_024375948.1 uncharacterized protein LOC112282515 [Physcomitrella patens]
MLFMCAHPALRPSVSSCFLTGSLQLWSGRGLAIESLLRRSAGRRTCKRLLVFVSASGQVDEPEDGDGKGDEQVQDMLVGMVRLQAGKMRVTEFVDERSKLLSDIADQAKEEYDKIAQDAMGKMDEASSKIISSVDAEAQAMEEELASARAQMEADSREFDEFEENVDKARSEGLFFKSLYSKPLKPWSDRTADEKKSIKEEAKIVFNVARKSGSSKTRRFLYGVLIFLLSLSLVEAVSNGEHPWPKLALYSFILVALVVQLTYESFMASDGGDSSQK